MNVRDLSTNVLTTFHGVPCKYGHTGVRYVNNHGCVDCARVRARQQNPVTKKKSRNLWRSKNRVKESWFAYVHRAKRKGRDFQLNRRQFEDYVTDNCFYCHAAPDPVNGIDRVNSDYGYTTGNAVTACKMCNKAKSDLSLDVFVSYAKRLGSTIGTW